MLFEYVHYLQYLIDSYGDDRVELFMFPAKKFRKALEKIKNDNVDVNCLSLRNKHRYLVLAGYLGSKNKSLRFPWIGELDLR